MAITVLTALIVATNYPDNILVTSAKSDDNGQYAGFIYLMDDGQIDRILLSSEPTFPSQEDCETEMQKLCDDLIKWYNEDRKDEKSI